MARTIPPTTFRRHAAWVGALLLLAAVLAWRQLGPSAAPASSAPPVAAPAKPRPAGPPPSETMPAAVAPPALSGEEPVPAVLPGHEGHGDECAECLGWRKLSVYREDYAQLQLSLVTAEKPLDPEETRRLHEACRRLAASVLLRWSFSDSRPVLAADEVVEAKRREILGDFLTQAPADEGR